MNEIIISKMHPSIDAYKELGFIFESMDNNTYKVTLPLDWTTHSILDNVTYLLDSSNRIRGSILSNSAFNSILLNTYYSVKQRVNVYNNHKKTVDVYFGNGDEVLFEAGSVEYNDYVNMIDCMRKLQELEDVCIEYANTHYPEWKNPLAFWDDGISRK